MGGGSGAGARQEEGRRSKALKEMPCGGVQARGRCEKEELGAPHQRTSVRLPEARTSSAHHRRPEPRTALYGPPRAGLALDWMAPRQRPAPGTEPPGHVAGGGKSPDRLCVCPGHRPPPPAKPTTQPRRPARCEAVQPSSAPGPVVRPVFRRALDCHLRDGGVTGGPHTSFPAFAGLDSRGKVARVRRIGAAERRREAA